MTPPAPDHALARPAGRLREAHAHLLALGRSLGQTSLAGCGGVPECLLAVRGAVARACAAAPDSAAGADRAFARLHSARVQAWREGGWPTLDELDAASAGPDGRAVPVVILSFDYHSAMANTAAMTLAGLPAPGTPVGRTGVVCGDRSGRPTGLLLEEAAFAAWDAAPEPTGEARVAAIELALASLAALGFDEVHDLHSQPWLGPLLAGLDRAGRLPLRVALYPALRDLEAVAGARGQWEGDRLVLGGGKLFADGTLNSRTALMLHRYAEPLPEFPRGQAMLSLGEIESGLARAQGLGVGLAVHAIGDAAVRMCLDAAERLGADYRRASLRVEHAEIIDAADVPRFARLGVTCSVQPCHLLYDTEALNRFLPHRLPRVLPLRELLESGLEPGVLGTPAGIGWGAGWSRCAEGVAGLVFGSDVPIVPADPEHSVAAARDRGPTGLPSQHRPAPDQSVAAADSWRCFAPR